MRWTVLVLCLFVAGCLNAPEKERADLRNDNERTPENQRDSRRAELRAILLGGPDTPPHADPHIRAEAARGLGNFGDANDYEVLLDLLLGPLADESMAVRLECAIALGKLGYGGRADRRRTDVMQRLRNRVGFERDESGRPYETEYLVRSAMLNSVIALGGRDAAIVVHDVAQRVHADLESVEASLHTSATDRGLLDRCFEGLALLTKVGEKAAAKNRFEARNLEEHLDWWAQRISEMPDSP